MSQVSVLFIMLISIMASFMGLAAPEPGQRNIIFLLTDDQRADTLGATGNHVISTPHLDSLAQSGVVFENMFVTTSICSTSRASILTGQYARRHGVWDFQTQLTEEQLSESYLGRLRTAGYHLGFIGKWGIGDPPVGYFDFDRTFPGQGRYFVQQEDTSRHLTSIIGEQIKEFLKQVPGEQPFCLSVSFKAAHVQDSYDLSENPFPFNPALGHLYANDTITPPRTAGPSFLERLPDFLKDSENRMRWAVRFWGPSRYQESVKGYYRLISGVDLVVGQMLQVLKDEGLYDSTAVIFSSDNGFFLGEHGLAGKWTPHEVSIRVPLVIHDPALGRERKGTRIEEMALNLDIAPTILEMAGLEVSDGVQGRSLLPLIEGTNEGTNKQQWRDSFFYEHLFKHPRIPLMEGVRTDRWKYIRYLSTSPEYEQVYDLLEDPEETRNLAQDSEYSETLEYLRELWAEHQKQAR